MQSGTSWTLALGKWHGVTLRVHLFFLLFGVFTLFLSWSEGVGRGRENLTWVALSGLGILLLSVILHECGHLVALVRQGGEPHDVVVWPLGGLAPTRPALDHRQELTVHLAGPLVNAFLCLVGAIAVLLLGGKDAVGLLHPLAPRGLIEATGDNPALQIAKLTCWINCVIWLANLLPAFPFDGGRVIREAIQAGKPEITPSRAVLMVTGIAKVVAVLLVVAAGFLWSDKTNGVIPVWFSLLLLAMLLYFSARHEEERLVETPTGDSLFGYDFSQGYTSLEDSGPLKVAEPGRIRKWLDDRRQERLEQQRQQEVDDERRVDEILGRLHEHGLDSLSSDERSILERVSRRYRHRR